MKTFTVTLPDELATFVESAVTSGAWPSAETLLAHAVLLARTEAMIGRAAGPEVPMKTKSGTIQAIDLTRQNFDSAAFVAGLVDKIRGKNLTQPQPGGA